MELRMLKVVGAVVGVAALVFGMVGSSILYAEPNRNGNRALCKAPSGEVFAEGETIQLKVSDDKGGFKTVTYVCTDHGWEKISRIRPIGPPKVGPGTLKDIQ
jgi:hypothetical protein